MTQFELQMISGHLIMHVDGKRVLIDTGAPKTVGRTSPWSFLGRQFSICTTFLGITPDRIGEFVGTDIHILLGADILKGYNFMVDCRAQVIEFLIAVAQLDGIELSFMSFMGIPIVTVPVGSRGIPMFFDTGAKLSYIASDIAQGYTIVAREKDFYPGFGEFETDVRDINIKLGPELVSLRFGILPSALEASLMMGGTRGIIGTEILETFRVFFFMPEKRMVMCRHGS